MDWEDSYPLFALAAVAGFVIALRAAAAVRQLRLRLDGLAARLLLLDQGLARLVERIDGLAPAPGEIAPQPAPPAVAPPAQATEGPAAPIAPEPSPAAEIPQAAPPGPAATPAPRAATGMGWERLLVEHWLVWLGAAAMALGGAFLVKLSIDRGLLTPLVRVILGVLLGIGLSLSGEWVRRKELAEPGGASGPSYVPPALAAAGAATVFASLYAAYALYGFLSAGPAFALLAATAGATVAQSLRQGPLVAALGLVGAYVVPLMVSSNAPNALPLFAYLAVVTAASLALLRHRAWWWLAWLSLGGATVWVPLWLGAVSDPEAPVVASYLLLQFALFVGLRLGVPRVGFLAGIADTPVVRVVTRVAFWAIAAMMVAVAGADGFGATTTGAAMLLTVGLMAFAYRDAPLDDVIAVPGVLALAMLAAWHLPLPAADLSLKVFRIHPDHVADFSTAAIVFAALLGGGGFALLPRVARPGRWAAVSAAVPLLVLVIAYWRLQIFGVDIAWSMTALALAGLELLAAAAVAQRRNGEFEIEAALAAYAVGVLGSTIFAATLALGEAWLTVALALHLPAMGWIEGRIRLKALRWLALGVAVIVLVRLVLNPYVLDYPLGPTPVFNWLLYGYGVPAAAFVMATRQFGSRVDDALVWVLEAGSALFTLLLLSLELIHAIYGRLTDAPFEDFGAGAGLIALWLVFATALIALDAWRGRPVLRWGGILLMAAATFFAIFWQLVMLLFGVRVGQSLVFDALLLADAIPALCYAMIAWLSPTRRILRFTTRVLAGAFAFAWVTLEIRHAFHDQVALFAGSGEAEWYLYSVAWLAIAGAALAWGLIKRSEWLRRIGLLGVGLVIAKVFLSDMSELSGVLCALSFLGLGGALVALGYAYRRLWPAPQT
jgi:uncharacterized membrane protein